VNPLVSAPAGCGGFGDHACGAPGCGGGHGCCGPGGGGRTCRISLRHKRICQCDASFRPRVGVGPGSPPADPGGLL